MRNPGLLAFGITTAVLAPVAAHVLDAGPNQVAKLTAPGNKQIRIANASIAVSVDRAFVDPGAKVQLTLTATAPTARRVAVTVLVYEEEGAQGGRVDSPPARIIRDTITLDVPTGAPATKQVALTLPGFRGVEMNSVAPFGRYTVFVMSPADAEHMDQLGRRANRASDPTVDAAVDAFSQAFNHADPDPQPDSGPVPDEDFQPFGTPGGIARLEISTRPLNSPVSLRVADTALVGYDIPITVTVKNPTSHALPDVAVKLETKPGSAPFDTSFLGLDDSHLTIDHAGQIVTIPARATAEVTFHVTANAVGTLALFATARCDTPGCYDIKGALKINDAALDAVDIIAAPNPAPEQVPTVVVK